MEADRLAVEVAFEVDLRGEAAARAAERLVFLPPFAPAAETCARTTVESNICTRCALSLSSASASKKTSNTPLSLSRQKRTQAAEEAAAKTTVKISFPLILFIFPCIFIVLLGPALLNMMHSLGSYLH